MNGDRKEQLLTLKQKILTSLTPLVLEGDGSPEEKLESALALIELGNVSTSLYEKSIDTANEIQDVNSRADYLMRLLGAVQSDLSVQTEVRAEQPQHTPETTSDHTSRPEGQ